MTTQLWLLPPVLAHASVLGSWPPAAGRCADGVTLQLYGWFTKGFDTANLQEARALLEELTG